MLGRWLQFTAAMCKRDTYHSFRVDHGFKMAEILGNASETDAARFESNVAIAELIQEEEEAAVEDKHEEKQEFTRSALMSGVAKELR
jgi:hypothetical protein